MFKFALSIIEEMNELSLIDTCCWRADHKILIHDGGSQSELISCEFIADKQMLLEGKSQILIHDGDIWGELIFVSAQ